MLHGVSAYYIPNTDAHQVPTLLRDASLMQLYFEQSEYIAPCDERLEFISGFTGSAGTAIVTLEEAALWTDGRYFAQAEKQLNPTDWKLMKDGDLLNPPPTKEKWIAEKLHAGEMVGVDASLISMTLFKTYKKAWEKENSKNIQWKIISQNLVDCIWGKNRPSPPKAPLIVLPEKYHGMPTEQKLAKIREFFDLNKIPSSYTASKEGFDADLKIEAMVFHDLADIAWTLNLRGKDVDFNPVFISYMIVKRDSVIVYIDQDKITEEVFTYLTSIKCDSVLPYGNFFDDLKSLANNLQNDHVLNILKY